MLDAAAESLPTFWQELSGQGWPGIHVSEEYGGEGASLLELAAFGFDVVQRDPRTGLGDRLEDLVDCLTILGVGRQIECGLKHQ